MHGDFQPPPANDGSSLWLPNQPLRSEVLRRVYRAAFSQIVCPGQSPTRDLARAELVRGLATLLGSTAEPELGGTGRLLVGTPDSLPSVHAASLTDLGEEGFALQRDGRDDTWLLANTDRGLLYGVFALLRHLARERPLDTLAMRSTPRLRLRLLNHWDNLDRTVERGYAGFSLWDWHKLPRYVDRRITDYARANASIGINGAVLTNVNAPALILTHAYLEKVAALANVLRPWGIRVYLSARFSAPIEIGALSTADPREPAVERFWCEKAAEIAELIPDFGGFLVKANSEGQPGPKDYGCSHSEGANLLARALRPHGGVVIWRAFVYDAGCPDDRAKQAFTEFVPEDGRFLENCALQIKNGPIDFQPREPFHPLFGAMPSTPQFLELQLTEEYLGQGTHLVYLAPLFAEVLSSDTFRHGPGSTVARVLEGSFGRAELTGIAGVANIGTDRNWCGHPFGASNWFSFGRLAWDPDADVEDLAREWLTLTFGPEPRLVEPLTRLMLESRQIVVDSMTPLGLHHIMARDHHFGPGPWVDEGRADWTSVYYHRADRHGVGFDRTATGSQALCQYAPEVQARFADPRRCPEGLLLWFHHLPWTFVLSTGRTLWDELCFCYQRGVDGVKEMQQTWKAVEPWVDELRFSHVSQLLTIQFEEACWWMDACLLYFAEFSGMPRPAGCLWPRASLSEYRARRDYFVPGIPERRFA